MKTVGKYPELRMSGCYIKGILKLQNLQFLITTYAQTMPRIPCTCNVLCQVVKNSFIEYVIKYIHIPVQFHRDVPSDHHLDKNKHCKLTNRY